MTEKLGMLEAARLTISIAAPAARMVLSISPVEQPGREHLSIDVALIETKTTPERSKPRAASRLGPRMTRRRTSTARTARECHTILPVAGDQVLARSPAIPRTATTYAMPFGERRNEFRRI